MKIPLSLRLASVIVCAASSLADPSAGDQSLPAPLAPGQSAPQANIRVELQVVAVPEQVGIPLVAEMKAKGKIEAANDKVQAMLGKGTAKLVGWSIVMTRSGLRAICEAIKEIRYATEYAPPTVGFEQGVSAESEIKVEPKIDVTSLAGVPTSFETRNAGVTLEVEAILQPDGKMIDLNLVPQHVRLKGFNKVMIEGAARTGKVIVEQPQFDSNKVTTSLTLQSGQRVLMGVYPTDDPPKHLEFFILKVETVPVD